jgi:hypothetical protein
LVVSVSIGYGIRRHEVGKKAATRDILNSIVFVVGFVILSVGLLRILPGPWKDRVRVFFYLIMTVVFWTYFIIWLMRKKQAGSVLLDLGRSVQHKMILIAGGAFMLLGIMDLVELFEPGSGIGIRDVFEGLFFLSYGVLMLVWGLSHFEIRESGILILDRFVNWKQIKSYEWEGKNGFTLTLRIRQRFPLFPTRSLVVPALHKDTVENLLEKYLQGDKNSP